MAEAVRFYFAYDSAYAFRAKTRTEQADIGQDLTLARAAEQAALGNGKRFRGNDRREWLLRTTEQARAV